MAEYRSTINLKMSLTMTADVKLIFGENVFNIERNSSKVRCEVSLVFPAVFGKSDIEMSSSKPFRINNMSLNSVSILEAVIERSIEQTNVIGQDKKLRSYVITPVELDSINHHKIIKDWHY